MNVLSSYMEIKTRLLNSTVKIRNIHRKQVNMKPSETKANVWVRGRPPLALKAILCLQWKIFAL